MYKISPPEDFEEIQSPSGYTSQPMSRDNSAGSNLAPSDARAAMSTSMPVRSSSFRSIFQSIPTRLLEFGRFGNSSSNNNTIDNNENSGMSPISPVFPDGTRSGGGGFLGLGIGSGGANGDKRRPSDTPSLQFGSMEPVPVEEARGRVKMLLREESEIGHRTETDSENRNGNGTVRERG